MNKARALRLLAATILAMALGCSGNADQASKEDVQMNAGLDALYTRHDPYAAAAQFRLVLEKNPAHYAATYQLATALEAAGQKDDARRVWGKALALAEAARDKQGVETARARLGQAAPTQGPDAVMQAGLDALYTKRDPEAAIVEFRKMLQRDPGHYGANYQLAKSLDLAGRPDEARPFWEKALKTAESVKDESVIATVRQRLTQPDVVSADAWMRRGIDALYKQRDPNAAITDFRQALELNPQHYGATYQLAAALDAAGKKDEAPPYWEQALKMAETYGDKPTADTARARLQTKP